MILWYALLIFQIIYGCNGCFPTRRKLLTDSYIPVGIQTLHYYKTQLQEYVPYSYSALCGFGRKVTEHGSPILATEVCVDESLRRINLLLIDLQREAVRHNLEDFQGFGDSVLAELEKTSDLTSVHQLHFVLKKLQKEEFGSSAFKCKILEFLNDLEDMNSKLYRNLLVIKPLRYSS